MQPYNNFFDSPGKVIASHAAWLDNSRNYDYFIDAEVTTVFDYNKQLFGCDDGLL